MLIFLAVWAEGPLGFGLLMSCRIVQAFQLYNIFVRYMNIFLKSKKLINALLSPKTLADSFNIYKLIHAIL